MLLNRLKFWLLIGLLASNLVVGVSSLFFLRSVNSRYTKLLDTSVPLLNGLRTLTRELSAVQRLARRAVDPDNEPNWTEILPQMAEDSKLAKAHARQISELPIFQESRHAAAIDKVSLDYDRQVAEFIKLAEARRYNEANQFNTEVLRPVYDSYQLTLDDAADYVQRQGNDLRARYAEDSRLFGGLLLAFAGWPLLAAALGILVMGLLIVALIVAIFAPGFSWRKNQPAPPPA